MHESGLLDRFLFLHNCNDVTRARCLMFPSLEMQTQVPTFRRVTTVVHRTAPPRSPGPVPPLFPSLCRFLSRHNVPHRPPDHCPPGRPARRPARLAARPSIHQHSAAGAEEQELEEPGCAAGSRWRHNVLLQHHRRICRRAAPYASHHRLYRSGWLLTRAAGAAPVLPTTDHESELLPTIESISAERAQRKAVQQQLELQRQKEAAAAEEAARAQQQQQQQPGDGEPQEGGIEGLEAEADQQGAFNPETGEINWDCPCLGGMASGPCGDEFKAAFSCFVFSKEEPKGMDCIDNFK